VALKLTKLTRIFSILFIIFILTFGVYINLYMFDLIGAFPYLIPIAASLPFLGFTIGFLLAFALRQTKGQQIAICIETGIQNIGVSLLIMQNSMPFPLGELGSVIPLIISIFTPLPLCVAALTKCSINLHKKQKKKRQVGPITDESVTQPEMYSMDYSENTKINKSSS